MGLNLCLNEFKFQVNKMEMLSFCRYQKFDIK